MTQERAAAQEQRPSPCRPGCCQTPARRVRSESAQPCGREQSFPRGQPGSDRVLNAEAGQQLIGHGPAAPVSVRAVGPVLVGASVPRATSFTAGTLRGCTDNQSRGYGWWLGPEIRPVSRSTIRWRRRACQARRCGCARVVAMVVGAALVMVTMSDVVRRLVIPRARASVLARVVGAVVDGVFQLPARGSRWRPRS